MSGKKAYQKAGLSAKQILPLCLAAAIPVLYYWIATRFISQVYAIVDDVMIRNIASGATSGAPDGHLVYMKFALGAVLAFLYQHLPGIDWYGCVMIGFVLLAFGAVLYRGLAAKKGPGWKLVYVLFCVGIFTCVGLYQMTCFQYTVVASIVGAAAVFFYYTGNAKEKSSRKIAEDGFTLFLLLAVYCIRSDVFLMTCPVFLLLFFYKQLSGASMKSWGRKVKKEGMFLLLLAAGIFLLAGIERLAYRSPAWKEYLSYNQARTQIIDYYGVPEYEGNEDFYESLSMSENDVRNLHRYTLYYIDDLQGEKMEQIAAYAEKLHKETTDFGTALQEGLQTAWYGLTNEGNGWISWLAFLFFGIAAAHCIWKKSRQGWLLLLLAGLFAAFWLYLGFRGRLPDRVSTGLYFLMLLSAAGVWFQEGRKAGQKAQKGVPAWKKAGIAVLGLLLLAGSAVKAREVFWNNFMFTYNNQNILKLRAYYGEHPENLYLSVTNTTAGYTDNFTIRRDFSLYNGANLGDWDTFTPVMEEKLRGFGVDSVPEAVLLGENVYVVTTYEPDSIRTYYEERGLSADWDVVDDVRCEQVRYLIIRFKEV